MKKNIFFIFFATISSLSFSQNQESEIVKQEEKTFSDSFIIKAGANFSLYFGFLTVFIIYLIKFNI